MYLWFMYVLAKLYSFCYVWFVFAVYEQYTTADSDKVEIYGLQRARETKIRQYIVAFVVVVVVVAEICMCVCRH